jgi:hypothetical protein
MTLHREEADMPGPISDSFDGELGHKAAAEVITGALAEMYNKVSVVLGNMPPKRIVDVILGEDCEEGSRNGGFLVGCFTEREWRIIRFALERAGESI